MGYDDPRLGGLLTQANTTGNVYGINWYDQFPSLRPTIDQQRADYSKQRDMVAANASMSHLWPNYSAEPSTYFDASSFPKQLIDSGQTTLKDLVTKFNEGVKGNRLQILPDGQVSFLQDIEGEDNWTGKLGMAMGMAGPWAIAAAPAVAAGSLGTGTGAATATVGAEAGAAAGGATVGTGAGSAGSFGLSDIVQLYKTYSPILNAASTAYSLLTSGKQPSVEADAPGPVDAPPASQAARTPDQAALRRTALGAGGPVASAGSSLLTGPSGVSPSLLNLGRNSVLGA